MSIIQQHTTASLTDNWRTINIDALDPDSSQNFDVSTLSPPLAPVTDADIRRVAAQVRQLLRAGDAEGALRGACESAPLGGDEAVKVSQSVGGREGRADVRQDVHLQTVIEVLQSIKASDMTPMLQRVYGSEGGSDVLDTLMKYL